MTCVSPAKWLPILVRKRYGKLRLRWWSGPHRQRAIQHQAALDLMLEMEGAGQQLRATAEQGLVQRLCDADIDFVVVGGDGRSLQGTLMYAAELTRRERRKIPEVVERRRSNASAER